MASVRYSVLAAGLFALSLSACAGYEFAPFGIENPTNQAINRAYKDRDACLTAQVNGNGSDAHAATAACQPQIRKLDSVTNPHRDAAVTAAIHQDSEFRATRYVGLARPVASSPTAIAQPAVQPTMQAPVPLTAQGQPTEAPLPYMPSIASPQ
jgi:hypothetical protein